MAGRKALVTWALSHYIVEDRLTQILFKSCVNLYYGWTPGGYDLAAVSFLYKCMGKMGRAVHLQKIYHWLIGHK